jgi:hypothetical protein
MSSSSLLRKSHIAPGNKDHDQKSKIKSAGRTKVFNPWSLHLLP